jgi:hypothetical protein
VGSAARLGGHWCSRRASGRARYSSEALLGFPADQRAVAYVEERRPPGGCTTALITNGTLLGEAGGFLAGTTSSAALRRRAGRRTCGPGTFQSWTDSWTACAWSTRPSSSGTSRQHDNLRYPPSQPWPTRSSTSSGSACPSRRGPATTHQPGWAREPGGAGPLSTRDLNASVAHFRKTGDCRSALPQDPRGVGPPARLSMCGVGRGDSPAVDVDVGPGCVMFAVYRSSPRGSSRRLEAMRMGPTGPGLARLRRVSSTPAPHLRQQTGQVLVLRALRQVPVPQTCAVTQSPSGTSGETGISADPGLPVAPITWCPWRIGALPAPGGALDMLPGARRSRLMAELGVPWGWTRARPVGRRRRSLRWGSTSAFAWRRMRGSCRRGRPHPALVARCPAPGPHRDTVPVRMPGRGDGRACSTRRRIVKLRLPRGTPGVLRPQGARPARAHWKTGDPTQTARIAYPS